MVRYGWKRLSTLLLLLPVLLLLFADNKRLINTASRTQLKGTIAKRWQLREKEVVDTSATDRLQCH